MDGKKDWIEESVIIFNEGVRDRKFVGRLSSLQKPSDWPPVKTDLFDRPNYEPPQRLEDLKSECKYDKKRHCLIGVKCPEGFRDRNEGWAYEYKLHVCKILLNGVFDMNLSDGDDLIDELYHQIKDQMSFRQN